MIRRFLSAKTKITVSGVMAGAVLGAGCLMVLLAGPLDKTPVHIIDSSTYKTQAVVRNRLLEVHVKLLRTQQCNSSSQLWLWRYDAGDQLMTRATYWVPIALNMITVSDASPLIQDITVAHPLPASVTPGQWFLRIKYADYCRLLAPIFGPTMRVSADIPVTVPVGWASEGSEHASEEP